MSVIREMVVDVSSGRKKGMKVMVESYGSAMEVVEDCRKRRITDGCFRDMSTESMGSFEGVDSYDEALDYLHNGYQPTVDRLRSAVNAKIYGTDKRMTFNNNIIGYAPVVPLVLKGVPNCMIDTQMKPIKTKVIDIYYDVTCSCATDSDEIIRNGQKVLGAIIELEKQGYRINLYAVQTYAEGLRDVDVLTVKLKSSTQPLDLRRISFPLTHTAFFRVIGFDWYSKTPKGKYRSGYGRALSYNLDKVQAKEFARQVWGDNAIYIAGKEIMHHNEEYIKEVFLNETGNK